MATLSLNEQKALLAAAAGQIFDEDDPVATEYVFMGVPDDELRELWARASKLGRQPLRYWSLAPHQWRELADGIDAELIARELVKEASRERMKLLPW